MNTSPSRTPAWAPNSAARRSAGSLGRLVLLASALAASLAGQGSAQTPDLVSGSAFRVCADPGNYPMSDDKGGGYENRIAEMLAGKLGLPVEYTWYPMATGFVRNTLRAARCDVVIGYAQGDEMVLNTNHYLTSAYTLVTRADGDLADVTRLDDPRLKGRSIGIVAGTPPATHMARNGLLGKAKSYQLMVDRRYQSPDIDLLNDLKAGVTDAAILWGPLAGPLVKADFPGLKVTPLLAETLPPRMNYRITMGVRQGEKDWQRKLNSLLRRHKPEIEAILAEAGVPMLDDQGTQVLTPAAGAQPTVAQ